LPVNLRLRLSLLPVLISYFPALWLLRRIISFEYLSSLISLIILLHFPVSSFNCPILSLAIICRPFDIPVCNRWSFSSPVIGRLLSIRPVIVSIPVKYIAPFYRTIGRCLPLFVGAIAIPVSVKYITAFAGLWSLIV
jgi:hypothetical protein